MGVRSGIFKWYYKVTKKESAPWSWLVGRWVGEREEGLFEHFKLYGYFEKFRKTATTAMWQHHKPVLSHRQQFGCAICLAVMQLLFIWRFKYILILLLSRVSLQYFVEVFCKHFPYTVEEVSL
jgi:hypothetical protein